MPQPTLADQDRAAAAVTLALARIALRVVERKEREQTEQKAS